MHLYTYRLLLVLSLALTVPIGGAHSLSGEEQASLARSHPIAPLPVSASATSSNSTTVALESVGIISVDAGTISAFEVSGTLAYVASVTATSELSPVSILSVFDITNPAQPVRRGELTLPGYVTDVDTSGSFGYIAYSDNSLRSGGIWIVDIHDPDHLTLLGGYRTYGSPNRITVVDHVVYVAADYRVSLCCLGAVWEIVDVSNSASPTLIFREGPYPGGYKDVQVINQLAYLAGTPDFSISGVTGLRIYDISNPSQPILRGTIGGLGGITRVQVVGSLAYALGGDLQIIDVSDPYSPTLRTQYPITVGWKSDLQVLGNYAYVATHDISETGKLEIINVTDPLSPTAATSFATTGPATRVQVVEQFVYLLDTKIGIRILWRAPQVTTTITNAGMLSSPEDGTDYIFPTGVFTHPTVITHTAHFPRLLPSPAPLVHIGHAFEAVATSQATGEQVVAGRPYTVTVQYSTHELDTAIETTLGLYFWNGVSWEKEPSSVIDSAANILTAQTSHLGLWAVLGETRRIYLPSIYTDN